MQHMLIIGKSSIEMGPQVAYIPMKKNDKNKTKQKNKYNFQLSCNKRIWKISIIILTIKNMKQENKDGLPREMYVDRNDREFLSQAKRTNRCQEYN